MNPNYSKKQLIINLFLFAAVIALFIKMFFFNTRTAYIDSNKIYQGYKGLAKAKSEFQAKVNLYKERTDTLAGRIKLDMLNAEKFRNDNVKYREFSDSILYHKRQFAEYRRAMEQSLKDEEVKLSSAPLEKVNSFLKEYGKRKGYDIILIANNTGTIAYAKDSYDITDDVLKELNQQNE